MIYHLEHFCSTTLPREVDRDYCFAVAVSFPRLLLHLLRLPLLAPAAAMNLCRRPKRLLPLQTSSSSFAESSPL